MKEKRKNIILVCGTILFTIASIEIFSLFSINILRRQNKELLIMERSKVANKGEESKKILKIIQAKTQKDFRLSRPKPYKDSSYFEWFIKEEWSKDHPECKIKITHNGNGFNLKQNDTENCRGTTIKNGWRVTTDQPRMVKNNIFIYGGSTAMNHEVPNDLTIASYLQRLLNQEKMFYKVNNRGFTSVVTLQQIEFLKKETIAKDDIIIFYDGGNNQWQGVANGSPEGTIIGNNRKISRLQSLKSLVSRLQSYKLLKQLRNQNKEYYCDLLNDKDLKEKANKAFDFYKKNLLAAKQYVEDREAIFLHFMQPHLFTSNELERSDYEISLIRSPHLIPICASKYLTTASDVFSRRHIELKKTGINSYDISKILDKNDPRRPNGEFFLDWIHITEKGNKAVALEIFKKIVK